MEVPAAVHGGGVLAELDEVAAGPLGLDLSLRDRHACSFVVIWFAEGRPGLTRDQVIETVCLYQRQFVTHLVDLYPRGRAQAVDRDD
ncbi:hypothetical protein GCM10023176_24550 [Micromonospora coerulea]|uniref:Uncharacterized protein n=1 Tax=Micromonospora coerulea TaxID=47856 RepID=A0ABP8SI24_9ACTN